MLRVYATVTAREAKEIMASGFTDRHAIGDIVGFCVGEQPLGANDGFTGPVVLAALIPVEVFNRYELIEPDPADPTGVREVRTCRAIVPAAELNHHGPAAVYDHEFAGLSRREMLQTIAKLEESGPGTYPSVADLRAAMEFLDEIGWRTPLKAQERPNG